MDSHSLSVYVTEVRVQCAYATAGIGGLNFALQQMSAARDDRERQQFFHQEVFRGIHSFLTHASNTSRLFWPPQPPKQRGETNARYKVRIQSHERIKRATTLRETFALNAESPLRARTLRDHLEHYDERLDHWRMTSVRHNIVMDFIGPKGQMAGIEETDMFRAFDPRAKMFSFRGEQFNLQLLADEVVRVGVKAAELEQQLRYGTRSGGA